MPCHLRRGLTHASSCCIRTVSSTLSKSVISLVVYGMCDCATVHGMCVSNVRECVVGFLYAYRYHIIMDLGGVFVSFRAQSKKNAPPPLYG